MRAFPSKATVAGPKPAHVPSGPASICILPPAHVGAASDEKPVVQDPTVCGERFWWEQIRAWRRSGQTRADYCRRHDLPLVSFNVWVTRLRHRLRRPPKALI